MSYRSRRKNLVRMRKNRAIGRKERFLANLEHVKPLVQIALDRARKAFYAEVKEEIRKSAYMPMYPTITANNSKKLFRSVEIDRYLAKKDDNQVSENVPPSDESGPSE